MESRFAACLNRLLQQNLPTAVILRTERHDVAMNDGGRFTLQASVSIDSFQSFLSASESGVSNRHYRSFWPARSYNLRVELLCKRLDDAGSQPAFRLSKNAIGFAHSVVGDRKLPVGPRHVVCNGNPPVCRFFVESML